MEISESNGNELGCSSVAGEVRLPAASSSRVTNQSGDRLASGLGPCPGPDGVIEMQTYSERPLVQSAYLSGLSDRELRVLTPAPIPSVGATIPAETLRSS